MDEGVVYGGACEVGEGEGVYGVGKDRGPVPLSIGGRVGVGEGGVDGGGVVYGDEEGLWGSISGGCAYDRNGSAFGEW